MANFTLIIILLVITSVIIQMIAWKLKLSNSYQYALLCAGIIIALAFAPVYLFHHWPSEHTALNLSQSRIFGFLSLKSLFTLLWVVWIYSFTVLGFLFVYHIEFEKALLCAMLLLFILFLCLLALFFIDLFYIKLAWLNLLT